MIVSSSYSQQHSCVHVYCTHIAIVKIVILNVCIGSSPGPPVFLYSAGIGPRNELKYLYVS